MTLNEFFHEHPRCVLAFSGGVDSAYLLLAARECGAYVRPCFVKTPFQPQFELEDASRLASELGFEMRVIERDILCDDSIVENPSDRCYHCKKQILTLLADEARQEGYPLIIDGTNASDDAAGRPGMRALAEFGVRSPLRECGLTKDEIRAHSKAAGLFTWNKPAYACLATRIPTGTRIERETLRRVEYAEGELHALGFSDLRVRVIKEGCRLQLPAAQMAAAIEKRTQITEILKKYFDAVLLDLEAR